MIQKKTGCIPEWRWAGAGRPRKEGRNLTTLPPPALRGDSTLLPTMAWHFCHTSGGRTHHISFSTLLPRTVLVGLPAFFQWRLLSALCLWWPGRDLNEHFSFSHFLLGTHHPLRTFCSSAAPLCVPLWLLWHYSLPTPVFLLPLFPTLDPFHELNSQLDTPTPLALTGWTSIACQALEPAERPHTLLVVHHKTLFALSLCQQLILYWTAAGTDYSSSPLCEGHKKKNC